MKRLWPLPLLAPSCFAAEGDPSNSIKRDPARTGTRLKSDAVTWMLPLNKTYAELTPEDRESIRRAYEHMEPADEPPFPLLGMGAVMNDASLLQASALATGSLPIFVRVDAQGEPVQAKILKSTNRELAKAVAFVLMKTKFKPAICGNIACEMAFPFAINFSVK